MNFAFKSLALVAALAIAGCSKGGGGGASDPAPGGGKAKPVIAEGETTTTSGLMGRWQSPLMDNDGVKMSLILNFEPGQMSVETTCTRADKTLKSVATAPTKYTETTVQALEEVHKREGNDDFSCETNLPKDAFTYKIEKGQLFFTDPSGEQQLMGERKLD